MKPFACRRFSKNSYAARHHGFFESNQNPKALPRSWQFYENTSFELLRYLKPFIIYLDSWYNTHFPTYYQLTRNTVDSGLGLYNSIFTTCVVNLGGCEWHIDPTDKYFAFIIYLGPFKEGGELILGPPISRKVPLKSGDLAGVYSSLLFHKANCSKDGDRWAIGFYTKAKQKITSNGALTILPPYLEFLKK